MVDNLLIIRQQKFTGKTMNGRTVTFCMEEVTSTHSGDGVWYVNHEAICMASIVAVGVESDAELRRLREFVKAIRYEFLSSGGTPFRICKAAWVLFAELGKWYATNIKPCSELSGEVEALSG